MVAIYKAEDIKLNLKVVLKFVPPELKRDSDVKQRFLRELRAASMIIHPPKNPSFQSVYPY